MAQTTRIGALAGALAAATMAMTPAHAAPAARSTPMAGHSFADAGVLSGVAEAEYHRRYRRHHDRIDGGDVLAGVLILGGIAAIASAASNNREREREERRRYEERRYEDQRYDDRRYDDRRDNTRSSGLDSAVSQCIAEIEQDSGVDSVDGASRTASGWTVSGTLDSGTRFDCQIGNNGRISSIDYSGFSGVSYEGEGFTGYEGDEPAEGQWSDANYAEARASVGAGTYAAADIRPLTPPGSTATNDPQPAYPGGPLPGEEGYPGG